MFDTIRAFVARLPLGIIAAIVVGSTLFSFGALIAAAVLLPPDYFVTEERRRPQNKALAILVMLAMNIVGLVLVLLGIVLSLPGVPGQGFLTIIVGFLLMDFPGKRAMERKLLQRPKVLHFLNSIRTRFHRPPLLSPAVS